jgi:hypothetical protein
MADGKPIRNRNLCKGIHRALDHKRPTRTSASPRKLSPRDPEGRVRAVSM